MPVIGYLSAVSANTSLTLVPFLQGLREVGFVEGQNVRIEYRWADGHNDLLPAMAADLVNRRVVVICAIGGSLPAIAAKAATATIPIVFQLGGDPVLQGLVASLGRPGGNATGSVNFTGGPIDEKAVQLLRELVPAAASLGLLVNPTNLRRTSPRAEAAARELGWAFQLFEASTDYDLKTVFETMAKRKVGAINVVPDPFFGHQHENRQDARPYHPGNAVGHRRQGHPVMGSLKSKKPSELPVQVSRWSTSRPPGRPALRCRNRSCFSPLATQNNWTTEARFGS
jgi:putative tryptophan/tyrosine transport system substrate-binding protein